MRRGMPARKTSMAERGEFGSTSARSNFPAAQFFADDGKDTFARCEGNGFVHRRMMRPKVCQFFRREQGDVRVGKFFPQPQQRGRGHHGVAQPVHAAHQNAAGLERMERRSLMFNHRFFSSGDGPRTSWPGRGARRFQRRGSRRA